MGSGCPSGVQCALQGYSVPFRGTVCPSGVVQPRTRGGSATDSAFAFGVRNTPVCGGGLCGRRLFSRGFNPTAIPTLNGTTYVCGDWRALVLPSPWLVAHCAGTRLATPLPLWERGFVVGWADAATTLTPYPLSPSEERGRGVGGAGGCCLALRRCLSIGTAPSNRAFLPSVLCASVSPVPFSLLFVLCASASLRRPRSSFPSPWLVVCAAACYHCGRSWVLARGGRAG